MPKETVSQQITQCLAEFVATLLFCFIGVGAVISTEITEKTDNQNLMAVDTPRLTAIALAHGLAIAVLVFATGHVSGGHVNPAVTVAMMATSHITIIKGIGYIICQFAGGIVGAAVWRLVLTKAGAGSMGVHDISNGVTPFGGIVVEFMLTFTLVFVIFSMAIHPRSHTKFAPLAIGFTVIIDILVGVPFTGGSMNPARTLAPAVVTQTGFKHIYIYFVGPILGALTAGILYQHGVVAREARIKVAEYDPIN